MVKKYRNLMLLSIIIAIIALFFGVSYIKPNNFSKGFCSTSNDCEIRGIDEWETCDSILNPWKENTGPSSNDAHSPTQDKFGCICEESKCAYISMQEDYDEINRVLQEYLEASCEAKDIRIYNAQVVGDKANSNGDCLGGNIGSKFCIYNLEKNSSRWSLVNPEEARCDIS